MADTKALFTQRFDAARAALSEGDEPAAAESLHSAVVVARSDPNLKRELASALFHLGKLSRRFGRAGETEAQSLLTEALAISEGVFGREHAALAPVLNELGRFHVHRSDYTSAEDVLKRLLAITRSKNEDNADVATALAALAVVKRKLGDDASAEDLFRDALRIREKVLEPSHMVTVVTLEQLSETCAARGNFTEALALLRRGLSTREVALGPGHASVQAARSRVTELELLAAVAADTAAAAAVKAAKDAVAIPAPLEQDSAARSPSTTLPSPIDSKQLKFPDRSEPRMLRPAALSRDRAKTPRVAAVVAAASLMASSIQTPSSSQIVIAPSESASLHGSIAGRELGVPHGDAVLAEIAHSDVASDDAALGELRATAAPVLADWPKWTRKRPLVLYVAVGTVAIALAGLLMLRPRAGGRSDPASMKSAAGHTSAPIAPAATGTGTGSKAVGAAAMVVATASDSLRPASVTGAPVAQSVKPEEQKAPVSDSLHLPRVNVRLAPINVPSISDLHIPAAPSVDSMARVASERPRASDTDRTSAGVRAPLPSVVDVDNSVTPAKIIGTPPMPRFPDALLRSGRRDGEVVVRFVVNEHGKVDVSSMIVEQSDDELFTAAVRDILPRFRFEPARTHAPESKPVASWVSVPFRFTTQR